MAEHFCRIEWNQEGFQAVRVYDGASLSPEERDRFCRAFAEGMWDSQTVEEVDRVASELADALGCRVETTRGGHADPLELTLRVALFRA